MSDELLMEEVLFEEIHQFILSEDEDEKFGKAKGALSKFVVDLHQDPDFRREKFENAGAVSKKILEKIKKFLGGTGRFIVKFLGFMAMRRAQKAGKELRESNIIAELKPLVRFMFQAIGAAGTLVTLGKGHVMYALLVKVFGKVMKQNVDVIEDAINLIEDGVAVFIYSRMMQDRAFAARISTDPPAPPQIDTTKPPPPPKQLNEQLIYDRWKLIAGIK